MLHDIFLHLNDAAIPATPDAPPSLPSFLLEHPTEHSETLRKYLKRHILRSKVNLPKEAEQDKKVIAAWRNEHESSTEEELEQAAQWLSERKVGQDLRIPGMGYRWAASSAEGDLRESRLRSAPFGCR